METGDDSAHVFWIFERRMGLVRADHYAADRRGNSTESRAMDRCEALARLTDCRSCIKVGREVAEAQGREQASRNRSDGGAKPKLWTRINKGECQSLPDPRSSQSDSTVANSERFDK
jgi:hypothetical protein